MASLFNKTKSKPKAFEHNDVAVSVSLKTDKKKAVPAAAAAASNIASILEDSDSDDDMNGSTAKSNKRKADVYELLDDEESDYKAQIRAQLEAKRCNTESVGDVKTTCGKSAKSPKKRDDKETKRAKAMLTNLSKTKKSRAATSAGSASEPEIIDLDDDCMPSFVVPKVVPASQRVAAAPTRTGSTSGLTLKELHALAGVEGVNNSASTQKAAEPERPQRKLRTRLNGVHERKWKVPCDESFAKIKATIATAYGLKPADIRLEFDGDGVQDAQTPDSLGLEDDDLVDAKINKAQYDAAVKFADSSKAAPAAPVSATTTSRSSSSSSGAPIAPAVETDKPSVRIRTRLNGKHVWKWKIALADPFSKLRANLSALYGLTSGESVGLEFDGDAVKDTQCPEELDIEDDTIIDVKIDKALYDKAIATAGPTK